MKRIGCVILPAYQEAGNIKILIPNIFKQAESIETHELHIVVVDDNSPDGTADLVGEMMRTYGNLHLLTGERRGLGEAYKRGMAYALAHLNPHLIFQMDADFQHDPSLLPLFTALAHYGFSLVIGSRFVVGGSTPDFPWHRRWVSILGTRLVRWFGGLPPLADCTSGYRCIRADLLARCDLHHLGTRGYAFQTSLLSELVRNGARVVEIPIVFRDRLHGRSKLSPRDYFEFLATLAKLLLRRSRKRIAGEGRPA